MSDEEDKDPTIEVIEKIDNSNRSFEEKKMAYDTLVSITRWKMLSNAMQGFLWASVAVAFVYFGECSC